MGTAAYPRQLIRITVAITPPELLSIPSYEGAYTHPPSQNHRSNTSAYPAHISYPQHGSLWNSTGGNDQASHRSSITNPPRNGYGFSNTLVPYNLTAVARNRPTASTRRPHNEPNNAPRNELSNTLVPDNSTAGAANRAASETRNPTRVPHNQTHGQSVPYTVPPQPSSSNVTRPTHQTRHRRNRVSSNASSFSSSSSDSSTRVRTRPSPPPALDTTIMLDMTERYVPFYA
ncbi:uncharacterized protein EV420DRAFT_1650099 [Desarmillaria tabescens]|uniref:Uncharacterized protein n=1 Tax=Armillaria tabescens TaxID=1929756 RepID=A0AA39JG77_ARMTA|nr:uncharacterized protein EV420DRAFT_1650099 [Desarmillaria tabescens]KAK0441492.1 hypothetical protein EV420DRAFT_1650099 [Desarmillaria tabescens]